MPAHIRTFNDLSKFGINSLTGEACAYAQRILCDVNEDGAAALCDFLGLPSDTVFAANWNSRVGDKPATGSVMIARGMFGELARFLLYREGFKYIVDERPSGWAGYMQEDLPDGMDYDRLSKIYGTVYINPRAVGEGSRNTHQMTGRTV